MKLSILIVSYNVCDLLERCLVSLGGIPYDWEVIVVDNDSRDGSKEFLQRFQGNDDRLRTVLLEQNVGFARGNIEAFSFAKGEYILLLNPDTKVLPNSIHMMVEYLESNPDVWVIGPKLLNEDGSVQRSVRMFPTLVSQVLILLKLQNYFANRIEALRKYLCVDFDYSKTGEVDQVMGAALMTRRSVIERIGFLDPGYRRIFEEVDFCYRLKKAGGKVVFLSGPRIVHSKGASFGGSINLLHMLKRQYYFNQGMLRFFLRHKSFLEMAVLCLCCIINMIETFMLWILLHAGAPLRKNEQF